MKTLFTFLTVMVVLFLFAPNEVEAQKRKVAGKTMEGIVTGYDGTRYWSGFKIESGGKEYTFVTEYNARQGTNPTIIGGDCCDVGTRIRVTYIGSVTRYLLNVTRIVILGNQTPVPPTADSGSTFALVKKGIEPIPDNEMAVIEMENSTAYGTIKIELYSNIAPKMVARFKELAKQGVYDGVTWHRVNASVVQSGDPFSKNDNPADDGMGKSDKANVEAEFSDILFDAGILGAARGSDNNSANSQFFITLKREPLFDNRYTIFGKVIDGMINVRSIATIQPKEGERPLEAIRIKRISFVPLTRVPIVENGFAGEWSDGTSWLTIIKDGNKYSAIYPTDKNPQVLKGELLVNNQLRLKNNKYGESFDPFDSYEGDFDNDAWIELGADGSFVNTRFSQARGGRSLVLKRMSGTAVSRLPEAKSMAWSSISVDPWGGNVCAITTTRTPYCWGESGHFIPDLVEVIGGMSIASVSDGESSTCWVTTDGLAYCLGNNLGNGTNGRSSVPTTVAGGIRFSTVSVGKDHTCGLATNGAAYCWGGNFQEQLGNANQIPTFQNPNLSTPDTTQSTVPFAVAGGLRFVTLSAGLAHTCAVTTDGTAFCWGEGSSGQLGDGRSEISAKPVAVAGGLRFLSVTVSREENFSCGVTMSGKAYCWGDGSDFQLGNGNSGNSSVPVAVAGDLTFTVLSAGSESVCGVVTNGDGYCWGGNTYGQLGTGTTKAALTPVPVGGNLKFTSIGSGRGRTSGITIRGEVYSWGGYGYGSGNKPTFDSSLLPFAISMPLDEDGFKSFYREFSAAVRNRDRTSLELMMSPKIVFPVDVRSPNMAFDYLGYNNGDGWKQLDELIIGGTMPYKDSEPRPVARRSNRKGLIFGRGANGRWKWLRFGY